MAQRNSGYVRVDADFYPTPAWVTAALVKHVLGEENGEHYRVWEPAAGDGAIVNELKTFGYKCVGSDIRGSPPRDFLHESTGLIRPNINAIITNPPYQRGLIEGFIRKSLALMEPCQGMVAMLCRIDFDSAVTRGDIFGSHEAWGTKLVLTKRIKWFDTGNKNGPSENHAWYVWDWRRADDDFNGGPEIVYGQ